VDDLFMEEPKTSRVVEALKALKVDGEKCLLVLGHERFRIAEPGDTGRELNEPITAEEIRELRESRGEESFQVMEHPHRSTFLSARNIRRVRTASSADVCTYDVMWSERVLLTQGAVRGLEERLGT
jgi:ribosomal protein L4